VAFIKTFATFLILLATMVPISLYVTMELVKLVQALHMAWDYDMYDPESGKHALVRSSGLNEELGQVCVNFSCIFFFLKYIFCRFNYSYLIVSSSQVEYIFSDKTGTLTQNLMEFRKCSVGTISYGTGTTEIGRAAALRTGKSVTFPCLCFIQKLICLFFYFLQSPPARRYEFQKN
jgi:phospholipid-transporting ATPase